MAQVPPASSPQPESTASALPVVARQSTGLPLWLILGGAVVAAMLLFIVLDARRRSVMAPAVRPRSVDAISSPAPPPTLYIPPELTPAQSIVPAPLSRAPAPTLQQLPAPVRAEPQRLIQEPITTTIQGSTIPPQPPARVASGSALMIDTSSAPAGAESPASAGGEQGGNEAGSGKIAGTRVGAGVLASRTLTVAQGTLIPAVLETALDSTLPGLARAVVSSDVRGFDGTRVLIPRGSRLIGEYGATTESGQNRMLVNWLRLIRPDGVTIAIGSPAADPVGRGGVRAKVDSHFFARFSGAILQSVLDVGVNLASRSANSPVIVALPGTAGSIRQTVTPNQVRPTLKVKPATSISVFVSRDLDFTGVETP
ncbi:TrbI/VirB10 family protein [Sphingomonas sp. RS6]